ncbi:hypothetical protein AB0E44_13745 [Micrococcus terreus]|uniref:hypothetical protein n=1 Tax=Micrococcus terreus TaxID=574650 RepID=UPI0033FD035F
MFLVALLLAGLGIYAAANSPRVHTAEVLVTFEPPDNVIYNEKWIDYTETLIAYSEVVESAFGAVRDSIELSSPQATLYGNGFREGISVDLMTTGNQWVEQLDRPVISIKVSSTDENYTTSTTTAIAQEIASLSDCFQEEAGIRPADRITAEWSAQEFEVGSYANSRFSQVKGAGVVVIATLLFASMIALSTIRSKGRHRAEVSPV